MTLDVLHHVTSPLHELASGLRFCDSLLCSTYACRAPGHPGLQPSEDEDLVSIVVSHVRVEDGSFICPSVVLLLVIEFVAGKVIAPLISNFSSNHFIGDGRAIVWLELSAASEEFIHDGLDVFC